MMELRLNPVSDQPRRHFLLGGHVSWTDIMRRKQYRETISALRERLPESRDHAERQQIVEAIALIESEINHWAVI